MKFKRSQWFFILAFLTLVIDIIHDNFLDDAALAIFICTAWIIDSIEKKQENG